MLQIIETEAFIEWFKGLKDRTIRTRIAARLQRLTYGNMGDVQPVGEGVSELRIHFGPGYRVYFTQRGQQIVLLLCGGSKATQAKDIATAKQLAKEPLE